MWLISTRSRRLEDFTNRPIPAYAILFHTWSTQEALFRDVQQENQCDTGSKLDYEKIDHTCRQALQDGLDLAWVDTCCIDKSSSAELSEAINSMFSCYHNAVICYAFLEDLPGDFPRLAGEREPDTSHQSTRIIVDDDLYRRLSACKWFSRGWTLQELIAPREVRFYRRTWNFVQSKSALPQLLSHITGVHARVLHCSNSADISQTLGDEAYALLGIFSVTMPMLYGEGERAFVRLQEGIIKASTDHSIFAWDLSPENTDAAHQLLAPRPACFLNGRNVVQGTVTTEHQSFELNNLALRITLPVLDDPGYKGGELAILNCASIIDLTSALALKLWPVGITGERRMIRKYFLGGYLNRTAEDDRQGNRAQLVSATLVPRSADMRTVISLRDFAAARSSHAIGKTYTPSSWYRLEFASSTIDSFQVAVVETFPAEHHIENHVHSRIINVQWSRDLPSGI